MFMFGNSFTLKINKFYKTNETLHQGLCLNTQYNGNIIQVFKKVEPPPIPYLSIVGLFIISIKGIKMQG